MNLADMARRGDRNLVLSTEYVDTGQASAVSYAGTTLLPPDSRILATKCKIGGVLYRGFNLAVSCNTRLIVRSPFNWYPFRNRPDNTGWHIVALDRKAERATLQVTLTHRTTRRILAHQSVALTSSISAIGLPCPLDDGGDSRDSDLELTFSTSTRGMAFLAVHRVLDRSEAVALCRGRGVEIGPGLQPQILPSAECDVTYVEQSSQEEWNARYNQTGALHVEKELWRRYTIGEAFPLPAEDHTLDFIFSSHVFEHLANPLGHLANWYQKLRQGGVVVGVVPDLAGTKDYVFAPCPLGDLVREYEEGEMAPNLEHYRRWAEYRAPGEDPVKYLKAKRSIHVHFYTNCNMASLLEYAVARLGYSWFNIRHTPNHKDFFFALGK